ncbi:WGR domain-containing protein [Microvirga yunnanensis]|uniref:WGR domain-containing protein n=1 Tax=Microvirga yunnanensis TaxID=2953740 RepID=UPI0021C981F9|nr:WGR domain-containing protein [Microvirga sp. HBU65207]
MAHGTIPYLVLHRCDPSCNVARYYVLSIEPSLFGDAASIRDWGRLGRPGQRRVELYENRSVPWKSLRLGSSGSADVAIWSKAGRAGVQESLDWPQRRILSSSSTASASLRLPLSYWRSTSLI